MKLTKETLKRIIKEELNNLMNEGGDAEFANQRGENHIMRIGKESAFLSSKHVDKPYTIKKGQQPYWGMIQKAAGGDEFSIKALRKDAGITDDLPLVFVEGQQGPMEEGMGPDHPDYDMIGGLIQRVLLAVLMRGADIDSAMDMERVPEEHRDYVRQRVMEMSGR